MTIVDTSVWIDYLAGTENPHTLWLEQQLNRQPIGLTDLIVCEVLQGIRDDASFEGVRRALLKFEVFDTGGAALAIAAARNYRALRSKGNTVRKTIDCLIASFCVLHGHSLLHQDRDFDSYEKFLGLRVVHP